MYPGKGKASARDNDDPPRGRQTERTTSRQPSAEHHQEYPDHPPVLPSSINVRDFAYQGPVERPEISHIWAPETIARLYAAAGMTTRYNDRRQQNDRDGVASPTIVISADTPTTVGATEASYDAYSMIPDNFPEGVAAPSSLAPPPPPSPTWSDRSLESGPYDCCEHSFDSFGWDDDPLEDTPLLSDEERSNAGNTNQDRAPSPETATAGSIEASDETVSADSEDAAAASALVNLAQDEPIEGDRAPFPAASAPVFDFVPTDTWAYPFDQAALLDEEQHTRRVSARSKKRRVTDERSTVDEEAVFSDDEPLSPRSQPVYGTFDANSRTPEGVAGPSGITRSADDRTEQTELLLSIDNEPSPRTQPSVNPLDNANSWIPEGVAGPSTIVRPPTPQREPQRYSDIDLLMQSRNDSGQSESADDLLTQQVILNSLQTAIVVNLAANGLDYGSDALENAALPSSSSDASSDSSEGLVMAPYQRLRRRLSPTPTPPVSPHLRGRSSPRIRDPNTGGSPAQGRNVLLRCSSRLRQHSPDVARREALQAERRAMERLQAYGRLGDEIAQSLVAGHDRRVTDWADGNIVDFGGVFLTRRADSTQLPHGYLPRFARRSVELVEQQRAEMDLFLLSQDDDREFVLPHSTHAPPTAQEPPDLTRNFRTVSVPPMSRGHADVELPARARSTSPVFTEVEDQPTMPQLGQETSEDPLIETPSPTLAEALMSAQNARQPAAQSAGQEVEGEQAGPSRETRDSVVRTSVGTGEKRDEPEVIEEEREEAAV